MQTLTPANSQSGYFKHSSVSLFFEHYDVFLKEPITTRRDLLAASLLSKQLFRDIEDEKEWIEEKKPIVTATNLGISFSFFHLYNHLF